MREYYLLRSDGTSVFAEGHCRDFIWHCYYQMLDSDKRYTVIRLRQQEEQKLLPFLICLKNL